MRHRTKQRAHAREGREAHLGVEVQHYADNLVGDLVVDLLPQEDDALAVQPIVEIHLQATEDAASKGVSE